MIDKLINELQKEKEKFEIDLDIEKNNKLNKLYKKLSKTFKFYIINYIYKSKKIETSENLNPQTYIQRENQYRFTSNLVLLVLAIFVMLNYLKINILNNEWNDFLWLKINISFITILILNYSYNILPNKLNEIKIIKNIMENDKFIDCFFEDIKNRKNESKLLDEYQNFLTESSKLYSEINNKQIDILNKVKTKVEKLDLEINKIPTILQVMPIFNLENQEINPMTFIEKTYLDGDSDKFIVSKSEILLRIRDANKYIYYKLEINPLQIDNFIIKYQNTKEYSFNKTLSINKDIWNNIMYSKLYYSKNIDKDFLNNLDKKINKPI